MSPSAPTARRLLGFAIGIVVVIMFVVESLVAEVHIVQGRIPQLLGFALLLLGGDAAIDRIASRIDSIQIEWKENGETNGSNQ